MKLLRIIQCCLLVILLVLTIIVTTKAASPFIPTDNLSIETFIDYTKENQILKEQQVCAHDMAECARKLGFQ